MSKNGKNIKKTTQPSSDIGKAVVKRGKRRGVLAAATLLLLALLFALWLYGRLTCGIPEGQARFYFFDVGQGDAAAVVTRDGCIVIDAGTEASETRLRLLMERAGIRRIDLAVFTHPHDDHIGGADMIIEDFEVGAVLMPETEADTPAYLRLTEAIERKNIELIPAKAGYSGEFGGLSLRALFASADAVDENDMSTVVKVSFGNTSAIFTGDAGVSAERKILARHTAGELSCGILKVGHHGSSTSTCAEWANTLSPQFAVVSCAAANDYGHPHEQVLRRLSAVGAEIHRTDIEGTVCFVSDGNALRLRSKNER